MKNLILIFIIILFNNVISAQIENYPKGVYLSLEEVLAKQPSESYNLELEKRTKGKIKMNGGNDFQINPIEKNVKKSYLKKEVYAFSNGDNLYINSFKFELQLWYSIIEGENDKYFTFNAGIPMNPKRYGIKTKDYSFMFGGLLAGFSAAKRALIRFPYLLNKETKEVILISETNIKDFIGSSSPQLLDQFEKETEKQSVETISKYLVNWINE